METTLLMGGFDSKQFKTLQARWYKKLQSSGFEEAEDINSPRELLKDWHSMYFQKRYTPDTFSAKQEYYRLACLFLFSHKFQNDLEKKIWYMHAEGLPIRKIKSKLKRTKISKVRTIITALSKIMLGRS